MILHHGSLLWSLPIFSTANVSCYMVTSCTRLTNKGFATSGKCNIIHRIYTEDEICSVGRKPVSYTASQILIRLYYHIVQNSGGVKLW